MPEYKLSMIVEAQDRASGPLGGASSALGKLGGVVAGLVAGAGLLALGQQALSAVADYERLGMALTSLAAREIMAQGKTTDMTAALAQAAPRAKELQSWVQKLAIQSPFTSTEVSSALRMAMAYGFGSEQAQRLTQALIDFSAGSGSSGAGMERIALALGQIQAKGKLAGQEVLQLTEAGLPVTSILAKAFGVTTAELTKLQEQGLIPADKAIEAITAALEKDFGGAAKRQTATWSGLLSTLSDTKERGLRELTGGMFAAVQPSIAGIVNYLSGETFMGQLRTAGESAGRTFGYALGAGAQMNATLKGAGLGDWLNETVNTLLTTLDQKAPSIAGVIAGISAEFGKAAASTVGFASNINALITFAEAALGDFVAWIQATFGGLADFIGGWFEGITMRGQAFQQMTKGQFAASAQSQAQADAAFARSESGKNRLLYQGGWAIDNLAGHWQAFNATLDANEAKYNSIAATVTAQATAIESGIATADELAFGTLANLPDDMRLAQEGMTGFAAATKTAADATAPLAAGLNKAADALADMAKTEFTKAQGQLKSLLPDMNLGGENAPGSNGPFEGIFRAADVAAKGDKSPWAAKLGLDQASAKQIVSDFAQGFRTPEVRKLIDEALLIDQAAKAQQAADSLTAWGNEIAAKAGVSTSLKAGGAAVTAAIFGNAVTGKDNAGTQTTSYGTAAKDMLGGFAGALATQVVDKELGKSLRDSGKTTFGIFEAGVVDAAKSSLALKEAILAMAANAVGATNTARSAGVNP